LLPDTKEGRHLRDQLMRSGTAPGAHYAEARGSQSRDDFVYKLSTGLKELREALHWLRVAQYAEYFDRVDLEDLLDEGEQLAAILTASQTTARRNK
jgi:four helix bundle protein